MAKDAVVSEELAKKFAAEKETPYTRWVRSEGLDIIPALYVRNLRTVELKPWARRGGNAVFVNHDASRISNDSYVMEIPAGKELAPHRQLYEEMILILDGRGSTTVWNNEGKRITFEWKAGSLFAIPLNAWHQHFNGSGREPPAMSGSPTRRRCSISTRISISSSAASTTSRTASTARPTISAPRASRRACCCRPTSWPTRSTCR